MLSNEEIQLFKTNSSAKELSKYSFLDADIF